MSSKNEKDIMEDVISDISEAHADIADDAAEAVAEIIEEVQEAAAESEAAAAEPETIVVTFENELDAERAVRVINKALRRREDSIYQGAMVQRRGEDELKVEDLRDMGLGDVITGTAGIVIDFGRDGARLAWSLVTSGTSLVAAGFRLLRKTALQTANLAGSTRTIPQRRHLEMFLGDEALQAEMSGLEPGETAVVIVADHDTASELVTDLVRSGGELV
ncbi:MAG: hypothetical protein ACK2UK_17470 [Candidatus Promineifilaceae bacterium]